MDTSSKGCCRPLRPLMSFEKGDLHGVLRWLWGTCVDLMVASF